MGANTSFYGLTVKTVNDQHMQLLKRWFETSEKPGNGLLH